MARDKFAALASRAADSNPSAAPAGEGAQSTAAPTGAPASTPPARQDKLAALVARAAVPAVEAAQSTAASTGAQAPAPPARPDKLAALASRAAVPPGGRGNKLAAMEARSLVSETPQQNEEETAKEEHLAKIKERLSKRRTILENLDRAEELTCKLLEIAHKTTTALQDLSSSADISELSKTYRNTLQELHPLLSTDTQDLIHPYQNHSNETKQSMYGARVEMRLARERTEVLKAFTELERSQRAGQDESLNLNNKRPREEETSAVT